MTTKMKNMVAALSAIVLFTTTSFAANTNTTVDSLQASVTVNEPLAVSFVGEEGNYLVFEVSVTSTTPTSLAISDKTEGELYTSKLAADKKQTMKIEKRDNQILDFTLSVGKEVFSKSFIMVPTVVVTKVK